MLPRQTPARQEIIRIEDEFYILATSALADDRTRVLKEGDTFAVFNRYGDITPLGLGEQGLYHAGTRFLSRLELLLGTSRPLLLSSTVHEENALLTVDLANPDVTADGQVVLHRDTLHLQRSKFLWQGTCYECLTLRNYALEPLEVDLTLRFAADFADIFEVRGLKRRQRGRLLPPHVDPSGVTLAYEGLDGIKRYTRIACAPAPKRVSPGELQLAVQLQPKEAAAFFLTISCHTSEPRPPRLAFHEAFTLADGALREAKSGDCAIYTSNEQFNDWLNRSRADLYMMVTAMPTGPYPYAGVPWFSTPFGRDGLITALEYLWVNPALARGVLAYLATTQAQEVIPEQDAEPGKILHEARQGEMAALGEIPFGRYYGSVDATPLFVVLAYEYYRRTGDLAFVETLWPHIELALHWIDTYGDVDGDGFVEYARRSPRGLVHQGWKDSHDAVFHADGRLAEGPIALCEVQGYVYAAKQGAAELAAVLGQAERAAALRRQAQALQEQFERAFWSEELGTYVLALDGHKRPCRVRSSNAGHTLFSGIASPQRARRVAAALLAEDAFSGWGIRTLSSSERRYNPMAYHNGSVWPHDNALIAAGMARYGLKEATLKVFTGLFDACLFMDLHRLPELFCGFTRRPGEGPTLYPVACAPQAWASAAVFLLLQACLGLSFRHPQPQICFTAPLLPPFLQEVRITNLRVGQATLDLTLYRYPQDVGVSVTRREGEVEIVVVK
ncbi:MAG: amylo-alpha-1,6-glucosidase [Candidatus Tectimicrobiota bacterium]|nr:MAG: amylo-alpha-1,6-glucosidase [Candidatus Tectomicrobia bacterium]